MWDSLHLFRSRRVILPEKAKQSQTVRQVIEYEGKSVQNHTFQKKRLSTDDANDAFTWLGLQLFKSRTVNGVINPACEAGFNLDPPISHCSVTAWVWSCDQCLWLCCVQKSFLKRCGKAATGRWKGWWITVSLKNQQSIRLTEALVQGRASGGGVEHCGPHSEMLTGTPESTLPITSTTQVAVHTRVCKRYTKKAHPGCGSQDVHIWPSTSGLTRSSIWQRQSSKGRGSIAMASSFWHCSS